MEPAPPRILLIDDHRLFRQGVRLILERAGLVVVGEAADGPTACELAQRACPDVVVADIHLPGEDGIAVASRILAQNPATKVVFLSSDADLALVRRALDAGGRAYLVKENADDDLLHAIEAAMKGGIYLCPEVASAWVKDARHGGDPAAPPRPQLARREVEVLRLIAEGLRNKEIADRLAIGLKSIETYRSRLMVKLGYSSTAELVRHAIREGIARL